MKHITIAGTIGRDAQTRDAGQSSVTGFPVAVDERGRNGEKSTVWFDCSLWGKRGDSLRAYLTKGGKVAVTGELSTREHNGKTYLQIRADDVTLMGGGQKPAESQREYDAQPAGYMDDEIPF